MKPVIEVNNITKQYRYSANRGTSSLREELYGFLKFGKKKNEHFLALDDISFKINQGESIGIIGNNGAGKSTLLKILSNVTVPTRGNITIRGSINSILELGTGFHPELTGRENIYFYGALQGYSRKELKSKFDEIVDFSGVEKFLDTPFKHFSSGMQVRLGFSIISHIDSDVLITDEVMAVGDAGFQKKSMKKMQEIISQGRTIIFVSHQDSLVSSLTKRCILIDKGRMLADGPTNEVLKLRFNKQEKLNHCYAPEGEAGPMQSAILRKIEIKDIKNQNINRELRVSEPFKIIMEFEVLKEIPSMMEAVVRVKTQEGFLMFVANFNEFPDESRQKGINRAECLISGNLLNVNQYCISASLVSRYPYKIEHFSHDNCLSFGIIKDPHDNFDFYGPYTGSVRPKPHWTLLKH